MTIESRVSQDRRNTSRVMARLDCCLISGETRQDAVMVDLSMKGAFLSAKILPASGSTITVELGPPAVKKPLSFQATVLRGTWVMSEHGKLGRFGIRFDVMSPDLIPLISKLNRW